jgi:hypothetical protein
MLVRSARGLITTSAGCQHIAQMRTRQVEATRSSGCSLGCNGVGSCVPVDVRCRSAIQLEGPISEIFVRRRTGENVPVFGWQCGGQGFESLHSIHRGVAESLGCMGLGPILKLHQLVVRPSAESRSCRCTAPLRGACSRPTRRDEAVCCPRCFVGGKRCSCSHLGAATVSLRMLS